MSVFTRRINDLLPDDDFREKKDAENVGGLRLIYYWHAERELFLMLFLYRKSEQKDLTAEQKRILARVVQQELK